MAIKDVNKRINEMEEILNSMEFESYSLDKFYESIEACEQILKNVNREGDGCKMLHIFKKCMHMHINRPMPRSPLTIVDITQKKESQNSHAHAH